MRYRMSSLSVCAWFVWLAMLHLWMPGRLLSAVSLVEQGRAAAPIVVYADAPPRTVAAAEELADYIQKISGTRPQVLTGAPDPLPTTAIWVGVQPVVAALFPGVDLSFTQPEEILLAANDRHVLIAGRDRWDPQHMTVITKRSTVEGVQQEYGTVNAIYTFLQDRLGVRWLWPGDLGEEVPQQASISVEPFVYRYHPTIRSRGGLLQYSRITGGGYGRSGDWCRRQRLQLDSLTMEGGHGFGDWWDRFHETHPDYFALQPDGMRSGFPSPRNAKQCLSNPAVWDQWLADVEEQLKNDPTKTIFNAAPNDGYTSGICVCDNCRAWDHPDGKRRILRWKGLAQEYVAMSDRYLTFANHLARKLKERYPDRDYYVTQLAYGPARPVPVSARPDDNVIIVCVSNFLLRDGLADRDSPEGVTYRQQHEAWGKIVPKMMWRPNVGSPVGWQQALPDIDLDQTMIDFKLLADTHVIGIYIDMVWEHWATQGPQNYLMGQLTWNPRADGRAILADYYQRGFGPAAATLEAYWRLMQDTRNTVQGDDGQRRIELPEAYDAAFFARAHGLLDEAARQLADQPPRFAERIAFLREGLKWSELVIDVMAKMKQYKAGASQDAGLADQIKENWKRMEAIATSEQFPYAINWGPVRPITPRMEALFPQQQQRKGAQDE